MRCVPPRIAKEFDPMPIYQYQCAACGPFDAMRRIAERDAPQLCPHCGAATCRDIAGGAMLSLMPQARREAFATNERSMHAPKSSAALGHRHGPNCGCGKRGGSGLKGRSAARPWMISH
jgi:putative FmdB family regulatory protein